MKSWKIVTTSVIGVVGLCGASGAHAAPVDGGVRGDVASVRAVLVEAERAKPEFAGATAAFDRAPEEDRAGYVRIASDPALYGGVIAQGLAVAGQGGDGPRAVPLGGATVEVESVEASPARVAAAVSYPDVHVEKHGWIHFKGIPLFYFGHYHIFTPSKLKNRKCEGYPSSLGEVNGHKIDIKTSRHQWTDGQTHCEIHYAVSGAAIFTAKTHSWGNRKGVNDFESGIL